MGSFISRSSFGLGLRITDEIQATDLGDALLEAFWMVKKTPGDKYHRRIFRKYFSMHARKPADGVLGTKNTFHMRQQFGQADEFFETWHVIGNTRQDVG